MGEDQAPGPVENGDKSQLFYKAFLIPSGYQAFHHFPVHSSTSKSAEEVSLLHQSWLHAQAPGQNIKHPSSD